MATSSCQASKFRNRQPDKRYEKQGTGAYRLSDSRYSMAFATRKTQAGFKYALTPGMERVKSGLEFRTRGKKTLWNKSGTITAAYKSLLSHFADHLMQPRGKLGHVHKGLAAQAKTNGYMWFMHPQVTDNNHNIHCMDATCKQLRAFHNMISRIATTPTSVCMTRRNTLGTQG